MCSIRGVRFLAAFLLTYLLVSGTTYVYPVPFR